ncbi:hypothetical protein [Nostoc sp. NMS4]|nr:hypothetical protein [Nostoc sp. NMS4]MBN3926972.1 hypothetical protein [Nostoc sp. NMS4]
MLVESEVFLNTPDSFFLKGDRFSLFQALLENDNQQRPALERSKGVT